MHFKCTRCLIWQSNISSECKITCRALSCTFLPAGVVSSPSLKQEWAKEGRGGWREKKLNKGMKIMKYSWERQEMRKKRDKDTVQLCVCVCTWECENVSNNEDPPSWEASYHSLFFMCSFRQLLISIDKSLWPTGSHLHRNIGVRKGWVSI